MTILGTISSFGQSLKALGNFWRKIDQKWQHIWATFIVEIFTFSPKNQFDNMIWCSYFKVSKISCFGCFVLSKWALMVMFRLFCFGNCFGNCFGYFFHKLGKLFPQSSVLNISYTCGIFKRSGWLLSAKVKKF